MSFSFHVAREDLPPLKGTLEALMCPDLRCVEWKDEDEELADAAPWPEDRILHFYHHGLSTRGVEVAREKGSFQVRIMTLSSPQDYELAFSFVEQFAGGPDGRVEPEDGPSFPASELRKRYKKDWIAHTNDSGVRALSHMIERESGTATVPGPVRPFHMGPRVLAELRQGPPEGLTARVLEAIKRVQYVDPEEFFPANVLQITFKSGGEPVTTAVWAEGVSYLFPDVRLLTILPATPEGADRSRPLPPGSEPFWIPVAVVPEVAGGRFRWLDEKQCLVEAADGDDWAALVSRARSHSVTPDDRRATAARGPDEPGSQPPRKWWQFWR